MTIDNRIGCVTAFIKNHQIKDEDVKQDLYLMSLEQKKIASEEDLTLMLQIHYGQYLLDQIRANQKRVVKPVSKIKINSLTNVKCAISMLSEQRIMEDEDYVSMLIELM